MIKQFFVIFLITCILILIRYFTKRKLINLKKSGYNIYCFWTGNNEMSENRKECLNQLIEKSECNVVLITPQNLQEYIDTPLHPSYEYLSETHKADYLRTYFMHFYGGGYSDIKRTTDSWKKYFIDLENSDYFICGYKELPNGVAYSPHAQYWNELIGNGAYICKPKTEFTTEWYNEMVAFLDTKVDELKLHPSKHPQDSKSNTSNYPIEWNEMLGRIFHRVIYKYKDRIMNTLPISIFTDYR